MKIWLTLLLLLLIGLAPLSCHQSRIKIGSKKFTESVILGELLSELSKSQGVETVHYQELGGTRLVFDGLKNGSIDAYPEYSGTISNEILASEKLDSAEAVKRSLKNQGILMSRPLGFNNTYALAMLRPRAEELGITSISDLAKHPDFRLGFTAEFLDRADDGWSPLKSAYGLPHQNVKGLDHDIAYRQLVSETIDVMDVYSTDAKIKQLDLQVLDDDLDFFPRYDAVILYREDLQRRYPKVVEAILRLEDRLESATMIAMNNRSESVPIPEYHVAREFLSNDLKIELAEEEKGGSLFDRIFSRLLEHLDLVRKSLIPAILIGIPLGIVCHRRQKFGKIILAIVGIIQTIPALALLVLVMPLVATIGLQSLGVGSTTAIVALFLYGLLPIVAATYAGLSGIESPYIESANALGLSNRFRLTNIELPLASRNIISGVKTAAVINIGFATLGALIGAGGFGQPILTGIRRADVGTILEGAIPAAILAVAVQLFFDIAEKFWIPKGLQSN